MLYRVKQFLKGLRPSISQEEVQFIESYLSAGERDLFDKLPYHEKRHAVSTARTIDMQGLCSDRDILIKAALLHDIGKIQSRAGIIKKSILVLTDKFFPTVSCNLSNKLNMFYVYYNHPELGARLLEEINTNSQVVLLVRFHHSRGYNEIPGLEMLKKADNQN